ncbi:MAG: hypothetical protein OXB88_07680 [Bacteriovoracales bacterium]|nr:hypothetical protein [Bacteriovoracales bacterium]
MSILFVNRWDEGLQRELLERHLEGHRRSSGAWCLLRPFYTSWEDFCKASVMTTWSESLDLEGYLMGEGERMDMKQREMQRTQEKETETEEKEKRMSEKEDIDSEDFFLALLIFMTLFFALIGLFQIFKWIFL